MAESFAAWLRERSASGRDAAVGTALAVLGERGWARRPGSVAGRHTLIVRSRTTGERTLELAPGEEAFAGRGPDCKVLVVDRKASTRHAVFKVDASGALSVKDLGSTNGTYVNGLLVGEKPLAEGDELLIGNTVILVGTGERDLPSRLLDALAAWHESPTPDAASALAERFAELARSLDDAVPPDLRSRREALAVLSAVHGALREAPTIEGLALLPGATSALRVAIAPSNRELPAVALAAPPSRLSVPGHTIYGELACGTWGALHWALDEERSRPVLLEELEADALARLPAFRERWPLETLVHPSIERVLSVHECGVIARELVGDAGLNVIGWPLAARAGAALGLLDAIAFAHGHAVAHGDVNERRIVVDQDARSLVLAGFGRGFLLGQHSSVFNDLVDKDLEATRRMARRIVPELGAAEDAKLRDELARLAASGC